MRLSRDKVNKLAHGVADALAETDAVDFLEDRNTIRMEVRRLLEELLKEEEKIDLAARHKIENQKRTILEAPRSGTSSTASTTTRKSRSWASDQPVWHSRPRLCARQEGERPCLLEAP